VKKWTAVDRALTPDGKTISLEEHDGSYFIRVDGAPLMSTRQHASEERIAELACAHLKGKPNARILIGGLGFGFTLKATLAALPADATIVVAEILAAVIEWNRNPAYPLAADAMADPRVSVVHRDVAATMRAERGGFDSIILDVDNGPAAFTTGGNGRLYDSDGLRLTRSTLRPGGCVAYWSAGPDAAFKALLAQAGFAVEVHRSRARGNAGARHTLFLGRVQ
jgi:spermidine synthase